MFSPQVASNLGPSISSILIYVLMAAVLLLAAGSFPRADEAILVVPFSRAPFRGSCRRSTSTSMSFATRILIYAMAAASLNLVLGYGGMVSFGHAAFFGAGAYIVGILAVEGVQASGSPGRSRSRSRARRA